MDISSQVSAQARNWMGRQPLYAIGCPTVYRRKTGWVNVANRSGGFQPPTDTATRKDGG
jgi:hypothetical protein